MTDVYIWIEVSNASAVKRWVVQLVGRVSSREKTSSKWWPRKTPSKLKCGIPIWKSSEEHWYLMLTKVVFPKILANWKEKRKYWVKSTRDNTSHFTKMYNFMWKTLCLNRAFLLWEIQNFWPPILQDIKKFSSLSPQLIRAKQSSFYNSKCTQNFWSPSPHGTKTAISSWF